VGSDGHALVGTGMGPNKEHMGKPFAIDELAARLHALLRRRRADGSGPVLVGELAVDPRRRLATLGGRELELTRREFDLLEAFAVHPGQVLSREQLLQRVWGYSFDVQTNVVDVFVGYLRRKLEADGSPRLLHTVRGVGFVLRP
jgi:two-component system, OmpR family, response regulator PrrA